MEGNIVRDKSFGFAVRVINLYKFLLNKKEFVVSRQVLRSGTSVGANIEEALGGQSNKDFIAKMSIAYKESRETRYWLRLLHETKYIDRKAFESLNFDCEELNKIISKILITSKKKNQKINK